MEHTGIGSAIRWYVAGASDYILKANIARDLLRAMEAVTHSEHFLSDGLRE